MKKLLITGMGLAIALSASTAMASDNQMSGSLQTLGNVAIEEAALAPMTGEQLNAVEGKLRYRVVRIPYLGHSGSKYNRNSSSVRQSNNCHFCGNGNGGFNGLFGGSPNSGVIQSNGNTTSQFIQ